MSSQICLKWLWASSCPSVCPNGTNRLPLDGFSWNLLFEYFSKSCLEKSSFTTNSGKNNRYFTWIPIYFHDNISLTHYNNKRYQKEDVQTNKIHILCSILFFQKSCHLWGNVKKNMVDLDSTQMTICRMRTVCYKHTLRICNNYCLSTATMVAGTRLIVTLHA